MKDDGVEQKSRGWEQYKRHELIQQYVEEIEICESKNWD